MTVVSGSYWLISIPDYKMEKGTKFPTSPVLSEKYQNHKLMLFVFYP